MIAVERGDIAAELTDRNVESAWPAAPRT